MQQIKNVRLIVHRLQKQQLQKVTLVIVCLSMLGIKVLILVRVFVEMESKVRMRNVMMGFLMGMPMGVLVSVSIVFLV